VFQLFISKKSGNTNKFTKLGELTLESPAESNFHNLVLVGVEECKDRTVVLIETYLPGKNRHSLIVADFLPEKTEKLGIEVGKMEILLLSEYNK
jgi:hypothetical protein